MARKRTRTKFGVSITEAGIKARQAVDLKTGETLTFDSKLEKQFYEDIIVKGVKDGTILDYTTQKKYNLQESFKYFDKTIRPIDYISDFEIWYTNGDFEVIDVKGNPTPDAKIKKKIYHKKYPDIVFKWMCYTVATGWVTYEDMQKIRKAKKKASK